MKQICLANLLVRVVLAKSEVIKCYSLSFEEMQLVIYSLIKQKELKPKNLEIALKTTSVYYSDKDKIFRVWQTLEKELWSVPEAVEKGFHKYISEKERKNPSSL